MGAFRRKPGHPLIAVSTAVFVVALAGARAMALESTADYGIEARYDQSAQTIRGTERITWTNGTPVQATTACLHLYWNAFANTRSTFFRETHRTTDDWQEDQEHADAWGSMAIESIAVGEVSIIDSLRFLHPDDNNVDDRTVVEVRLPRPIEPGESVSLDIGFTGHVPRVQARAGHVGPFTMMGQWFPKLAVFDGPGWNCHQYHSTTEFFSDFGRYDVRLTVPSEGVVGATGSLTDEKVNGDGTKTLTFRAEPVHDFAWAIDPRFVTVDHNVGSTRIRLLVQPAHVRQRDRYLHAASAALRYYEKWFGEYPYAQLTIIDPPYDGREAGGMEYPTLITAGTSWAMPARIRLPEYVTVHEFGHQYWYGLVANNEFEEAWLDEGINSYVEGLIMDETYGPGSYADFFGLRFDRLLFRRALFLQSASRDPMVRMGWQFIDRQSYAAVSYAKTALVLETLARVVGPDVLRTTLAEYANTWRFRHPTRQNLLAHLNRAGGKDLSPWIDQLIQGSGTVDFAVTRVDSHQEPSFAGRGIGANGVVEPLTAAAPDAEKRYASEVVIERLGDVRLPVDVEVTFEDGTTTHEHWDGQERWRRFEYSGSQRVEWAVVDPSHVLMTDINWLNNSRMREAGTRGIIRVSGRGALWFQTVLHFLGGL